jgi:hypothetical protein
MGKTIFTCVYNGKPFLHVYTMEKKSLKSSPELAGHFQSNLIEILFA